MKIKTLLALLISSALLFACSDDGEADNPSKQATTEQSTPKAKQQAITSPVPTGNPGERQKGVASLFLSATETSLSVRLESPASNFFGFEREPKTEAERNIVNLYLSQLKDVNQWLTLQGEAECTLASSTADFTPENEKGQRDFNWAGTWHCKKLNKLSGLHLKLTRSYPLIKGLLVEIDRDGDKEVQRLGQDKMEKIEWCTSFFCF